MAKLFTEGLYGEELKETEIGLMPKSWEVVTVGSLAVDGIMNGAFVKNPQWGTGTRFLNVVDTYKSEQVNVDLLMRLELSDGFRRNYALKNKDVLFVRSSLKEEGIGQPCFVDGLVEPVIYDCHLMKLSPKLEMVDPFYMVLYCLTEQGKKGLISKSNKTTMTTINQRGLADFPFPLAPLAEQKEIVRVAERLNAKLLVHQYKLTKWQGLFNSMLHQLMTGQIRVNNIEVLFDA
jgi:type I restriction enzyme S subunit